MQDDEFEWDDQNAADHFAKHGVSFETARAVFRDSFAIEYDDLSEHYSEPRSVRIGKAYERTLVVVYETTDQGRWRLISAREAQPFEARKYHEENRGNIF